MDRHSPPLIIDAPDLAYLFDSTHLASRISRPDRPPVSIELNLHPLWHVDRSESICFHNPQSAIRNPQSAIRNPQSAIRNPQSAIVVTVQSRSTRSDARGGG